MPSFSGMPGAPDGTGIPGAAAGFGVPPVPVFPSVPPVYDGLTPMGPPTAFKEGGASVKIDTFDEASDRKKALTFLQQFDAAFSRGTSRKFLKPGKQPLFSKRMLFSGGLQ